MLPTATKTCRNICSASIRVYWVIRRVWSFSQISKMEGGLCMRYTLQEFALQEGKGQQHQSMTAAVYRMHSTLVAMYETKFNIKALRSQTGLG